MAFGDKSKAFQEAKDRARREQQAVTVEREAAEVSPDDLTALDEAEEAAMEAADIAIPVVPVAQGGGLSFEQMLALFKAASGGNHSLEQIAAAVAKATRDGMEAGADRVKPKELKISDTERKSAFNPDGEKANPRPKLKCHMYFGSAPLGSPKEVTTLKHSEIAALNAMTPGHYRIEKLDGSKMVVEVRGQLNSNRELDRMWIILPEGDEQKNLYPSLTSFATQCSDENRVTPEMVA